VSQTLFDVLIGLHVTCAIVGFGSVAITGTYGFTSRHPGDSRTLEEAGRYFRSPGRLELLVLAVPFLGAAALAVGPHTGGVVQLWTVLAASVWLVASIALLGVVRPAERRIRLALSEADRPTLAVSAGRLGWATVVTDVCFTAALILMIFQPH